jgi:tetratricopeptide (TPR) repeat protein
LEVIQEAVDLCRQLAADRPDTFNPNLAVPLYNLSLHLFDLGHHEHALEAIQESVDLRRQLATDRPGVFNSVFASSLAVLSQQLTTLGQQVLEAFHEAAMIRGQCAAA